MAHGPLSSLDSVPREFATSVIVGFTPYGRRCRRDCGQRRRRSGFSPSVPILEKRATHSPACNGYLALFSTPSKPAALRTIVPSKKTGLGMVLLHTAPAGYAAIKSQRIPRRLQQLGWSFVASSVTARAAATLWSASQNC